VGDVITCPKQVLPLEQTYWPGAAESVIEHRRIADGVVDKSPHRAFQQGSIISTGCDLRCAAPTPDPEIQAASLSTFAPLCPRNFAPQLRQNLPPENLRHNRIRSSL